MRTLAAIGAVALAVLLAGRAVLVARLAVGGGLVGAAIEAHGLTYARNVRGDGRAVFVPAGELAARFGRASGSV